MPSRFHRIGLFVVLAVSLAGCANLTLQPPTDAKPARTDPPRYVPGLDNPDNHKSYENTPR